jgi:DNA-binding NarL/FixJ family response regulator
MTTVLIVDDSEVDRRLAGGLVAKSGRFEVHYAASASEALQQIRRARPSVVVTDLHMPDRGGLMLIESCRMHYADLPVVLMTALGSENLVVEALRLGAAGYVPKAVLNERLVETLDDVLSQTQQDDSARRLIERLIESEFSFELDSDPDLVPPLVDMVQQMLGGAGVCDAVDCTRVGHAFEQAVLRAMLCGNLEMPCETSVDDADLGDATREIERRRSHDSYRDRRVHIDLRFSPREGRMTIRHQGQPLWQQALSEPLVDEHLDDPHRRTLVLLRSFCDHVQPSDDGLQITLVKRRP